MFVFETTVTQPFGLLWGHVVSVTKILFMIQGPIFSS